MYEPLSAQFAAEAIQQHPGRFLGRERDAFIVDQGDAVAVAVEGDAQVGPLAVDRVAQIDQFMRPRAIGRTAAKLRIDRVVNRGEKALREDRVQVTPRSSAQQPCMGSSTTCRWADMDSTNVSCKQAT